MEVVLSKKTLFWMKCGLTNPLRGTLSRSLSDYSKSADAEKAMKYLRGIGMQLERIIDTNLIKDIHWAKKGGQSSNLVAQSMEEMRNAVFCVVPVGITATSRRFYEAIMNLCIPLLVADRFAVPFDSTINTGAWLIRSSQKSDMDDFISSVGRLEWATILRRMQSLRLARSAYLYPESGLDVARPNAADMILVQALERVGSSKSADSSGAQKRHPYPTGKNLLLALCLAPLDAPASSNQNCAVAVRTFLAANAMDDVTVLTVDEATLPDQVKTLAAKQPKRLRLEILGKGPFNIGWKGKQEKIDISQGAPRGALRYVWIDQFLEARGGAYDVVLVADTSERLFFQLDPFELIGGPKQDIIVFEDAASGKGGAHGASSPKTTQCLGSKYVAGAASVFDGRRATSSLFLGRPRAIADLSRESWQLARHCGHWDEETDLLAVAILRLHSRYRTKMFADGERAASMRDRSWNQRCCGGLLVAQSGRWPLHIVREYNPIEDFLKKAEEMEQRAPGRELPPRLLRKGGA
eukprot:TRINITY_DN13947_c0_g1_i3.p1 TRINITY_DN13947_c0_g1~~TRINITY_DN13947_c0_g1_i3.p1  ORF type:complete len:538 (+),score=119.14 TRINITY_DN13947_c0_g1_i3:46-1614(+)